MRKLLSQGLVVFASLAFLPGNITHTDPPKTPAAEYQQIDPRLENLQKFFLEADCPALAFSEEFIEAADTWELDWRLLPSISFVESAGGKAVKNNNLFGWDSGRAEFPSWIAGIHKVAFYLANSSLYKDKSLDELLKTYNPNTDYAIKVKAVMQRISASEAVE